MKKYLLSTFAVLAAVTMTTNAKAADTMNGNMMGMDHMYARADVGYSMGTGNTDKAGLFGLGVGGRMNDYFRAELVGEYRPFGKEKFRTDALRKRTKLETMDAFMNVYASYPIMDSVSLYATGGIGYAHNKTKKKTGFFKGDTKSNFAWNVGAGMEYMITPCWGLDIGYRFTDLGTARAKDVATNRKIKQDVKYNDIKMGLKYYF